MTGRPSFSWRDRFVPAIAVTATIGCLSGVVAPFVERTDGDLLGLACVLVCATGGWCVASWWYYRRTLFDPYMMFFLLLFGFNASHAPLYLLGALESGPLRGEFSKGSVSQTLFFVSAALGALHVGALLALKRDTDFGRATNHVHGVDCTTARIVGVSLIGISIVPAVYMLHNGVARVMSGGYMALYQEYQPAGLESAIQILSQLVLPGSLIALSTARDRWMWRWIPVAVLTVYAISLLFLGARGHSSLALVAAAWLWHRTVKPLPIKRMSILALIVLIVVFPVIAATREQNGPGRSSAEVIATTVSEIDSPAVAIFSEMGMSMNTIAHTINFVPRIRPFQLGSSYLYGALTVFPSLFWSRHPAIARGTPSTWLTEEIQPAFAAIGGGMGYSVIAEAFLNAGWLGPVILGVIGMLVVKLWLSAEQRGPIALSAFATFLPTLLFSVRADSTLLFRPLVWYAIIPYLVCRSLAGIRQSRRIRAMHSGCEREFPR